MANSITPSGTSRNVFDISLSDFETAGTVTAAGFIGSGANLTKININNTEYILELSKGGTGNNIYNNDGGLIYFNKSSSRFTNDYGLTWDKTEQILKINNAVGNVVSPYYKKIMHDMGMKRDGQTGNLIIEFNIIFPSSLSESVIQDLNRIL